MNTTNELTAVISEQIPKDLAEVDVIYLAAVNFAGKIATIEAEKNEDNHGGVYLHRSIGFGD